MFGSGPALKVNDVYGVANLDSLFFGRERPDLGANYIANGGFESDDLSWRWGSWTGAALSVSR